MVALQLKHVNVNCCSFNSLDSVLFLLCGKCIFNKEALTEFLRARHLK